MGAEAASPLKRHLEVCDVCRALVAEAARVQHDSPGEKPTEPPPAASGQHPSWLQRGTLLGRYMVLERIGSGGMGVVHAAYDPELDRRVALKLIRVDTLNPAHQERAQARLLREAQATARVIHPNVITIHDVGRFGEHVFLAMELVEGTTLRSFSRTKRGRRDWKETLERYLQAGRGLAAAHAQGLVHRDFKPDNALVGRDGRVRITDFGLARIVQGIDDAPEPGPEAAPPGSLRSEWLTRSDILLGTPAYMAPEQKRGVPSDARSDQYSYCVALHEALYGRRPFTGPGDKSAPAPADGGAMARPPRDSDVPAWIHKALLQGLAENPDERHASMDALLRQLSEVPGARLRRASLVASAALVLVVGGAALHRSTSGDPCAGTEQSLTGVWDPARKDAVRTVFAASPLPYARGAWSEVERTLDAYASAWVGESHQACVAARVQGQQTERLYERRVICLDQRLDDLRAVVDTLASGDGQVIENAVRSARSLESLAQCANLSALASPEPPSGDEQTRRKLDALTLERARAKALLTSGKMAAALELATQVARDAHDVGYGPDESEALYLLAQAQMHNYKHLDAIKTLHASIQAAEASRHDRQVARSWAMMVRALGFVGKEVDPGEETRRYAAAALKRLGGDPRLEAMLARNLVTLYRTRGRPHEALAQSLVALEMARKVYALDDPELGTSLLSVGQAYGSSGRPEEGVPYLLEAQTVFRRGLGPDHPNLAAVLDNIAVHEVRLGNHEAALKHAEESLAIQVRNMGAENISTASTRHNMAGFLLESDRPKEAYEQYAFAARIREKALGPDSPKVASSMTGMARSLSRLGRTSEALPLHERALAVREKAMGPDHAQVGFDLMGLGETLLAMKEPKKARPALERALVIYERQPAGSEDADLADTRYLLAVSLEDAPATQGRAQRLMAAAKEHYLKYPKANASRLVKVEHWLATRTVATAR
ncbi:serine/threonine-protein kinase [Myxococcus sp. K15C18031901]|uniref:serine/threonine-protein kinase n=1 Tax=Myxococcus dinghuensis TaxID=2906761 RepID=UPI0020A77A0D|nr:tetratricopeptide repeat protein [Myxococcus dinghuensis]MCP3102388.1 serine/threonine-protein kinase [Myxococcus dinghuensis]